MSVSRTNEFNSSTINSGSSARNRGLLIAGLGWLTMVLGLFLGTVAGNGAAELGASLEVMRLVQAVVVSLIVVPAVIWICRTFKLINTFLPMSRRSLPHFAGGIALTVLMTGLGLLVLSLAGWIESPGWNISYAQVLALLLQIVTALLYEALPEELTMRGLLSSGLRMRVHAVAAFLGTNILFVFAPIAVNVLQALVGMTPGVAINPAYVLMLFLFSTVLQLLRMLTGSLWASIGFHLSYLMIARFIFGREDRFLTYTESEPGVAWVIILFIFLFFGSCAVLALLNGLRFWKNRRNRTEHR